MSGVGSGVAPGRLRAFTGADWAAVAAIHDAARCQELQRGGVPLAAWRPMDACAEEEEFFDSETRVAETAGAVAGFVSWRGAYITWMYVHPAAQGRGLGSLLLRRAKEEIGPGAWVNVIGGNAPAERLYRKHGFERVFERPGHCAGHPCRLLRMALPTSPMRDPSAVRVV